MSSAKRLLDQLNDGHYKRFKCPECDEYSLHIDSFTFAECEEGCMIKDENIISQILDTDDFEGYFTDEDLQNNFF